MDEEQYLIEALARLHNSYIKAAKPYIDQLAMIRAMRQPESVNLTLIQAQTLGLLPDTTKEI